MKADGATSEDKLLSSVTDQLLTRGLIRPPSFVSNSVQYETIMGSVAYGVSTDTSDIDVYGFCIPPKDVVWPHLAGEIPGFGRQKERFDQFQQHHVKREDNGKEYDLSIYNIVKYFSLCMENNPNMIDSLFTPANCVLHSTSVGNMVRANRKLFLHKGSWHKFKGYAYSQLHKMSSKNPEGKRLAIVEKYGYDVKFGYHVLRLLDEAEQIMVEGDIDLQRNREQLKAVRRGDISEKDLRDIATQKERELEKVYLKSKLRYKPDEATIKDLLLRCLEEYYGSIDDCVSNDQNAVRVLRDIDSLIQRSGLCSK